MGCIHSQPYVPDGDPIEPISFRRQSGKKSRAGKDLKPASQESPQPVSDSSLPPNEKARSDRPISESGLVKSKLFKGRMKHKNELNMSVESLDAVELEITNKKAVQKWSLFPAWKKYDRCSFCVKHDHNSGAGDGCASAISVSGANGKDEAKATNGKSFLKITCQNPQDPHLCRQCSKTFFSNLQNNMRVPPQSQGVNLAIANLLALTALDLTAPASDALLKNRKNAWIQVAGHPGSFAPAGPNTIWKKRMEKENYETKTYQALMEEPLREMVPKFHREVEYNGEYFIEMEDLLQHFSDPNIMDMKMGKRTFLELEVKNPVLRKDLFEKMVTIDPDAPTEEEKQQEAITKLRYMQFREEESSTADLGFRIEAIRMSGEPPNTNLKKTKSRQQVAQVMKNFFKGQRICLQSLLDRFMDIRDKFESSTYFKTHEIIGSSLLIMYDAEKTDAWMIDFAKTIPVDNGLLLDHRSPWKIGNHEDGYLSGMDNLVMILQDVLQEDNLNSHMEIEKETS